ncbi:polygalacturonase PglB [Rhizobium sp. C4]|uniref:polygalacturonase PglB n=1 Tax=Rhizobium sp. C4 TaxID=1349800 RepID=UPI001E3C17A6|nr:glycoside hydrolase family 28 protein [Rhizobium sp. C4]MCD2172473.1 glycoside hydrolase family 28 protein [Rhizobium sp. C4]
MDLCIDAAPGDVTARLQNSIDRISAAGGGRLVLMAGEHVCAGLRLRSGVEVHLSEGAVLKPVPNYDRYAHTTVESVAEESNRAMFVAENETAISISGPGLIDAGGSAFIDGDLPEMGTWMPRRFRPRVLVLDRCKDIVLSGFTVVNSPMWTLHAIDCAQIVVRDVTVDNDRRMPNTDGFVVDACRDVLIERSTFRTADDGIVLKTTARPDGMAAGVCRDIRILGCTVESKSCAIKIGTESHGDVMYVVADHCVIEKSNRGLGIFSRDGGAITNVRFSNIVLDCAETRDGFWGSGEALTVNVVDRKPDVKPAGRVANLVVENVTGAMEGAINLFAERPGMIDNVRLSNIAIDQRKGVLGTAESYDLRPGAADLVPAPEAEGRANAWVKDASGKVVGLVPYPGGLPGLYAHNVEGLKLENVSFFRPVPLPQGWNGEDVVISA